jgi:enoyl-CoA hydratase/carnithine racemase
MNADVVTTHVADGIAVITLGNARRMSIDQEMSDALFEALNKCAGDPDIRVVIVTGGAPGHFGRHYSILELIRFAESVRGTGREWPEARSLTGPSRCASACPNPSLPPFLAHAWPVHSN